MFGRVAVAWATVVTAAAFAAVMVQTARAVRSMVVRMMVMRHVNSFV